LVVGGGGAGAPPPRPGEALAMLQRVVALAPDRLDAWEGIAMYKRDVADLLGAGEAYLRAYRLAPDRLDLALSASLYMPPTEGADLLVECLERHPGEESLLMPLAELLMRADRMEEAEATLQILRIRRPATGLLSRHLGAINARLRRYPEAAAALYEAMLREPNDWETWSLLSAVRDAMGDSDGAVAAIDRAVSIRPEDLNLIGMRARLQQHAARADLAQAGLQSLSPAMRKTANVRLLSGMILPPITDSNEQIDALRDRWLETMADVEARPTFVSEPWESIELTGYYLGYHGRKDRPHMEALARANLAASPHLWYTAPNLSGGGGDKKIKVGFLSAHMRLHSVGRVLIKLMGALDRDRFEVILFQLPDKRGAGQELGEAAADRTVKLVPQLEMCRAAVEEERLDVLIYCDLHLNAFADALSFSRLAPVQATTWGHPGTGGRNSIDYWISCEDWEVEGNERLYTEKLVRLKRPPFVYTKPVPPQKLKSRSEFGLPTEGRLYGCLQSLFKLHPDYDAYFAGILEQDPKSRIVLISGPHYTWREQLKARFARSFDPSRVDFIPTVPNADYLSAVAACDVMLDPIYFAGANTTLEAFALGKPVVTLRGDQMRNRATGGFYRQLGYEKLIAEDRQDYVDLTLRLAQDRAFYREAKEAILEGNHVLYENPEPVADFEAWLEEVAGR
jgi:protein O-GlcNAc transferase